MDAHKLYDGLSAAIVISSVAHAVLPPWDFLADFPRTQKVYKAVVLGVGAVAINLRGAVYKGTLSKDVGAPEGKQ